MGHEAGDKPTRPDAGSKVNRPADRARGLPPPRGQMTWVSCHANLNIQAPPHTNLQPPAELYPGLRLHINSFVDQELRNFQVAAARFRSQG